MGVFLGAVSSLLSFVTYLGQSAAMDHRVRQEGYGDRAMDTFIVMASITFLLVAASYGCFLRAMWLAFGVIGTFDWTPR